MRQSVYLPAHLYGELCRHSAGAELLAKEKIPSRITEDLKKLVQEEDEDKKAKAHLKKENVKKNHPLSRIIKIKSYLWALVSGKTLVMYCSHKNIIKEITKGISKTYS